MAMYGGYSKKAPFFYIGALVFLVGIAFMVQPEGFSLH
jgi:hypothetical protein